MNRERAPFVLTPDFIYVMGKKVCTTHTHTKMTKITPHTHIHIHAQKCEITFVVVVVVRTQKTSRSLRRQQ